MSLGVMVIAPGWVAGEHIRAFAGNPHTRLGAMVCFLEEEKRRGAPVSMGHRKGDFCMPY